MAYILGATGDPYTSYADQDGEPTRTACRWMLLRLLHARIPGLLADLEQSCLDAARAVASSADAKADTRSLLRAQAIAGARRRQEHIKALVDRLGKSSTRTRLDERAGKQAALWEELVVWASSYRLTTPDGQSNRWLLQVALDTLHGWTACTPTYEWHLPSAPSVGDLRVPGEHRKRVPEFRRRQHPASDLDEFGPLARDFDWLVRYVITDHIRTEFAPQHTYAEIIARVKSASHRAGFTLPSPLRIDPTK